MYDQEVNKELKRGNPDAFTNLFKELHPRLSAYCHLFLKEDELVEDLIQDSFTHLWDKRKNIDIKKSIEAYMFIIVRNKCFQHLKDRQLTKNNIPIDELQINELQYLYQLDFTNRKETTLEEQLSNSLHAAIDGLPAKRKEVFIKNKIEGIKQKDIAIEMGVSVKVVEKHISKAKAQLRKKLESEYGVYCVLITLILL